MEVGDYQPPRFLFNRHLETIYPALLRRVTSSPQPERITTSDDDFLDLDWQQRDSQKLVIISHGLEGNCRRAYVQGMARAFYDHGFDTLAWNFRGCGEEMNRQLRFYHSGATDDLHRVVMHAIDKGYSKIFLVGFSLGGNLTLKYLGEQGSTLPAQVRGAAAFSVPLNLDSSCDQISKPVNFLYALRFLRSLKKKIVDKSRVMKGLDTAGIEKIRTLRDFDDRYTAPLHGFSNASEYYRRCSALYFLESIRVRTLVVSATNDPFLSRDCFPTTTNANLTLRYPKHGGHVGFVQFNQNGLYWSEATALQFADSLAL